MKSPPDFAEWVARLALFLILLGLPVAALGYQFLLRPRLSPIYTVDIVAAAPEAGGFRPEVIRVPAGRTVRLRFSAPDVTHGLAIGPGEGEWDFGQIDPGTVKEVDITFDRPGRYTLYCNTWCSPNHWRMRSVIEVTGPDDPEAPPPVPAPDPALEALAAEGVDIDAPHPAPVVPPDVPSAVRGATLLDRLGDSLPPPLADPRWRQSHSPAEAHARLTAAGLSPADAWDVVAALWLSAAGRSDRQTAAGLYAKNCAACHGETGDGRGPGAEALAAQGVAPDGPPAFANAGTMLGGRSDVYYAKIRRGGMGTGMPGFGPLFTPAQTWALVDYLWTFQFQYVFEE